MRRVSLMSAVLGLLAVFVVFSQWRALLAADPPPPPPPVTGRPARGNEPHRASPPPLPPGPNDSSRVSAAAARVSSALGAGAAAAAFFRSLPPLRPSGVDVVGGRDRSPSDPFVTGDGFRDACRPFIFDETTPGRTDPAAMRALFGALPPGGAVFVQTHHLDAFIDAVQTPILDAKGPAFRFVLVTHNSDYSAPWEPSNTRGKFGVTAFAHHRAVYLPPMNANNASANPPRRRLTAWYAQNAIVEHPLLFPIPIGLENRYNRFGAHPDVYLAAMRGAFARGGAFAAAGESAGGQAAADRAEGGGPPVVAPAAPFALRPLLLFVNFNTKTNKKERLAAAAAASANFASPADRALVTIALGGGGRQPKAAARATLAAFLTSLGRHRFVLAPRGHGVDTHRLWEALYCGCVPVTASSPLDRRLLAALPVLRVDGYAAELTPARLAAFEAGLRASHAAGGGEVVSLEALSMAYWRRKIAAHAADAALLGTGGSEAG